MTIHTQQSLSGFLASQPQLAFNAKGEARFWVRIGQEHFERNEDGTFTQTETTYHNLVMFRRNAERAYAMFSMGDVFIAEGYTHTSTRERDGEIVETEVRRKAPRPRLRAHQLHLATPTKRASVGGGIRPFDNKARRPTRGSLRCQMTGDEPLHFPGHEFEPPTPDGPEAEADGLPSVPRPVNWNLLTSDQAAFEWVELDRWVNWLRRTYGLGPSVIPPLWHRHPELVWELSALHLHWLCAYDEEQHGSAPLGWHRDFADARGRLHDWVAACGSRLDLDRSTRQTAWPGEDPVPSVEEIPIEDRAADFRRFVVEDVAHRRAVEHAFMASEDGGSK